MKSIIIGITALFKYRSLVSSLVRRELKSKYRGSALGFVWSFLNPLLTMLVYMLVFSVYMRWGEFPGGPYWAYLLCGLVPWIWFANSVMEGTGSIVAGGNLITKVMFPPHILPTVSVFAGMINFLLTLPLLFIIVSIPQGMFGSSIVLLPLVVIIQLIFMQGLVLMLSALNAHFRDVGYFIQNFLILWFFLCPIVYSSKMADEGIMEMLPKFGQYVKYLNPMDCLTRSYQTILFSHDWPHWKLLAVPAVFAVVIYVIGHFVFNRYRDSFAEVV